jgi:isopenicillin-N N-acyltransferase like protein
MKTAAINITLVALLALTWVCAVLHMGAMSRGPFADLREDPAQQHKWYPRQEFGINQLILSGAPYDRGVATAKFTGHLIASEEADLLAHFIAFMPNSVLRSLFMVGAMRWFTGIDEYFDRPALEEMYGVAAVASPQLDRYLDGFTRQIMYHGVHEVGQMYERQDFGCTLLAAPYRDGWIVGRNFDFEAIRAFDTEKIIKWVFPDTGIPYVAVTWAGMVGVVTGVNQSGVFISLNAAGTSDTVRYGTPTTLVAHRVLQEARTASEAVAIISAAKTFITDIYVVIGPNGEAYRVEKSPLRHAVVRLVAATAVANHLTAREFSDDPINRFRRDEQTSLARMTRGMELVTRMDAKLLQNNRVAAETMLSALRDRSRSGGALLGPANRQAIDAMIATHSVVYNSAAGELFVGRGPALAGAFLGFDLAKSFAEHRPVGIPGLAADSDYPPRKVRRIQRARDETKVAVQLIQKRRCQEGLARLMAARRWLNQNYEWASAVGDAQLCLGDKSLARDSYRTALALDPAYPRHRRALEEKLRQ